MFTYFDAVNGPIDMTINIARIIQVMRDSDSHMKHVDAVDGKKSQEKKSRKKVTEKSHMK